MLIEPLFRTWLRIRTSVIVQCIDHHLTTRHNEIESRRGTTPSVRISTAEVIIAVGVPSVSVRDTTIGGIEIPVAVSIPVAML